MRTTFGMMKPVFNMFRTQSHKNRNSFSPAAAGIESIIRPRTGFLPPSFSLTASESAFHGPGNTASTVQTKQENDQDAHSAADYQLMFQNLQILVKWFQYKANKKIKENQDLFEEKKNNFIKSLNSS